MPGPGYTSPKSKRGKALGLKKPKFTLRSNTQTSAPKRTTGRYVVAPGYKSVKRGKRFVPKRKTKARRKSSAFTYFPTAGNKIANLPNRSFQPQLRLTKSGKLKKDRYKKGTIQYEQAQRFARSPAGELTRQLRKEEKRQSALYGEPVRLKLNRQTGKITRIVGAKKVAEANIKQFENYKQRQATRREERERRSGGATKFEKGVGAVGKGVAGFALSLLPTTRVASGMSRGQTARTQAKSGIKIKTSGINLPKTVDQKLASKTPENVIKLVDQTQRPVLGITGGAEKIVRNIKSGKRNFYEGVPNEIKKGLTLEERDYGSDVLKAAGIGGPVAAAGGFAIDVLADPLTYLTLGAGSVAKVGATQAAKSAARQAERKAYKGFVKSGMPKAEAKKKAKRAGERAGKQAFERASKDDRFAFRVGGKRRGKVIKTPFKVDQKPTNVRGKAKSAASNTVRPTTAPAGADPFTYAKALNDNRGIRAVISTALARSQISADWLAKKVKTKDYPVLIDALEKESKRGLPEYLIKPSVKVRVAKESTPEYRQAFKDARKRGLSVDEATEAAVKATRGNKQQYRKISIYDAMRSDFKNAERLRRRAGQSQGSIRGYFPHMVDDLLRKRGRSVDEATDAADAARGSITKTRAARSGSTLRRALRMPVSEVNQVLREEGKPLFSVDVPLVVANYKLQTGRILSQAALNDSLANLGRRVRIRAEKVPVMVKDAKGNWKESSKVSRSVNIGRVKENERVYVKVFESKRLDDDTVSPARAEWRPATPRELRVLETGNAPRNVRDVAVIDKASVRKVQEAFDQFTVVPRRLQQLSKIDDPTGGDKIKRGAYYLLDTVIDPTMRVWKGIATRTPQFHLRNMVGDFSMAYNVVPAARMPQLAMEALKVTWYLRGMRKNMLGFSERDTLLGLGIRDKANLGRRTETIDVADLSKEMIDNGVVLGGVLGSDLDSYSKFGARGASKWNNAAARGGRSVDRALQDRENFMRIVVYKHFRDEGLEPAQAARKTANALIDYGELNAAEREIFKRLAPFYTFAARSIPIFALAYVQRPGKIANIEKLRQETARATGTDAENLKDEQSYRQRGYAFPIRINGKEYSPSFGLPLMALNNLPAGFTLADVKKTIDGNMRFWGGSLAPVIGIPLESWRNYSFYYGRELEPGPPRSPRSAAALPGLFYRFGEAAGSPKTERGNRNFNKTFLKIGPVLDRRTGKMVVGMGGIPDNALSKAFPGAPGLVLNLTRDTSRRGQSEKQMWFSFFSGIKADTADPEGGMKETLFKELTDVDKELASLQPDKSATGKREKKKLNKEKYQIQNALNQLDQKAGNARPLFSPPGRKKKKGWADSSGGMSGGWATRKSSGSDGWAK